MVASVPHKDDWPLESFEGSLQFGMLGSEVLNSDPTARGLCCLAQGYDACACACRVTHDPATCTENEVVVPEQTTCGLNLPNGLAT